MNENETISFQLEKKSIESGLSIEMFYGVQGRCLMGKNSKLIWKIMRKTES